MTEDEASAIYDILVEHCGASDAPNARWAFVQNQVAASPPDEYRFQGARGFGGKCWSVGWRVGCYPEDRNEERQAMIVAANAALLRMLEAMS